MTQHHVQDQVSCNVAAILQRGHTVDRLTEAELQEVAENISALQKQRAATAPAASSKEGEYAKKPEASQDTNAAPAEKDAEEKESKAARKKRLHARNMRYYRSFLSSSLATFMHHDCVPAIMSLPMDLKS